LTTTTSDGISVQEGPRLRKALGGWQVLALSVGLMAPSMAININPQGSVGEVGRAIPLSFLVAAVGVLLVSWTFVRLSQHFHTSGSVFGFVGATLGPRIGAASGWALVGTYMFYGVTSSVTGGRFVLSLFNSWGIWSNPPDWFAYFCGAVIVFLGYCLAVIPARRGTDTILSFEAVTVALIAIVSIIVVAKLAGHGAPAGDHFTLSVFTVPKGTGFSALALGCVFGFLSFAGFESSAALGEEAEEPRRQIPRAIIGAAIIGGIFYVVISAIEVMGFGTSTKDLTNFANSTSLFGDLGRVYGAGWLGDIVTVGTTVSALGCTLASIVGASRLLYSLAKNASEHPHPLAKVSHRFGTPVAATAAITAMMYVTYLIFIVGGINTFGAFSYTGTIGTLIILAVYLVATLGAVKLIYFSGPARRPWAEIIIPTLAVVMLGYVLYRNVWPYPTGAGRWLPVSAAIWILIGLGGVIFAPGVAARIGRRLTEDEGLRPDATAPVASLTAHDRANW
jgi:amino acid transporter